MEDTLVSALTSFQSRVIYVAIPQRPWSPYSMWKYFSDVPLCFAVSFSSFWMSSLTANQRSLVGGSTPFHSLGIHALAALMRWIWMRFLKLLDEEPVSWSRCVAGLSSRSLTVTLTSFQKTCNHRQDQKCVTVNSQNLHTSRYYFLEPTILYLIPETQWRWLVSAVERANPPFGRFTQLSVLFQF